MRVGASLWEEACPCRRGHVFVGRCIFCLGVSPCDTRSVLMGVGMSFWEEVCLLGGMQECLQE